jgi:ureidoacrylate peracid hydrolase
MQTAPSSAIEQAPDILAALEDRLAARHTALLIIDMQKDFCLSGYGAQRAGRDIGAAQTAIPAIAVMLAAARKSGARVAHVGFSTLSGHRSDSGPWLAQRRRSTFSADDLCITGSEGAEFVDELAPAPGEWVVPKHRYSAFSGTDLDMLLRSRGIRTIIVTGVSTNACVESTLRAGFELDYYICVPPDCVGSWDRALHEATLANVNHRFGVTVPSADIQAIWEKTAP